MKRPKTPSNRRAGYISRMIFPKDTLSSFHWTAMPITGLAEATAAREGVTADAVEKRTVQNIPLGRMAEPSELADLIVFLASDRGRYITGTTIPVDGGYLRGLL